MTAELPRYDAMPPLIADLMLSAAGLHPSLHRYPLAPIIYRAKDSIPSPMGVIATTLGMSDLSSYTSLSPR